MTRLRTMIAGDRLEVVVPGVGPASWWRDDAFPLMLEELARQVSTDGHPGGVVVRFEPSVAPADDAVDHLLPRLTVDAAVLFARADRVARALRVIETGAAPLLAVLDGPATGPSLAIALACHGRVATPDALVGLPEITVGLPPVPGTVTRLVRLLGVGVAECALLDGETIDLSGPAGEGLAQPVDDGLDTGVGDGVGDGVDDGAVDGVARAVSAERQAAQPWDRSGYRLPGGDPRSGGLAAPVSALPSRLRARLGGAADDVRLAILQSAIEGLGVSVDTAIRIEVRQLVRLAFGDRARRLVGVRIADPQAGGRVDVTLADRVRDAARAEVVRTGLAGPSIRVAARSAGVPQDIAEQLADCALPGDPAASAACPTTEEIGERLVLAMALSMADQPASAPTVNLSSVAGGFPAVLGGAARFLAELDGGAEAGKRRLAGHADDPARMPTGGHPEG